MRSNEWLGVLKSCTGPTGLVSTLLPAQTHSKPELNEHTIKKRSWVFTVTVWTWYLVQCCQKQSFTHDLLVILNLLLNTIYPK